MVLEKYQFLNNFLFFKIFCEFAKSDLDDLFEFIDKLIYLFV